MPRSFDFSVESPVTVERIQSAFSEEDYWLARLAAFGGTGRLDSLIVDTDGSVTVAIIGDERHEGLPGLVADCRQLLDEQSKFLFLTVYAVRMSALAIGELMKQIVGDLGGVVEMGEMAVREEARDLLLPTAIFARWSKS